MAAAILLVGQPDSFPCWARSTCMEFLMVSSWVPGGNMVTSFLTSISCLAVFPCGTCGGGREVVEEGRVVGEEWGGEAS